MMPGFTHSEIGADPIVVDAYFAASPAQVFEAWTDQDAVMDWFGYEPQSLESVIVDLRPGGQWRFTFKPDAGQQMGFEGEYIEVLPNKRLVYSWRHFAQLPDGERELTPASRVEVDFENKGIGTQVRLVHSGIKTDDARKGVGHGWTTAFGSLLKVFSLDQSSSN